MNCHPIGFLRTPFKKITDMPIQPAGAGGMAGLIELCPDLVDGLQDLDGFSHLIVLYHFHRTAGVRLTVTPFLDDQEHGVFATRAPSRPNPIGLSILRLERVVGTTLEVSDVDMLDESPVLDIKPYVPAFDQPSGNIQTGWLNATASRIAKARSDERFEMTDDE